MNHSLLLFLTIIVFSGDMLAQSFSPEVILKSGVQRITVHSFNPDYEQQNTLMHELEIFHPIFSSGKTILSFGINGSLRRESDNLKTYSCSDCSEFNFKSHAFGARLKLSTKKALVVFNFYSGLNHNQVSIQQIHYGYTPPANVEFPPLQDIQETYLNLDTGFRLDIPVYKFLYISSDIRLYFPFDDSDFNQRRTAFSVGLNLKF